MAIFNQQFDFKKIGLKNVFLLLLVAMVLVLIGVIAKAIGKSTVGIIDIAKAQSCWTAPPGCSSCVSPGESDAEASAGCASSDAGGGCDEG